jgi:alkanesulfonate monooxygenase SsuD/methylene tetrahydromethanopterin reductase-like flavin-dependent oxidoreductase (luciferase family)
VGRFAALRGSSPSASRAASVDLRTGEGADLVAESLLLVGSPDTVTRQLERLIARLPFEWLFCWTYNALIPHAALMHSIDLFHRRVLARVNARAAAE